VLGLNGHVGCTGDQTPVYDAFFAGGFSSLRGFEFHGAGPRDIGVSVGGFGGLAGAEYLFPITADDSLRGVVFLDMGTVEPSIWLPASAGGSQSPPWARRRSPWTSPSPSAPGPSVT
jgi:outer membrane protein insertion porin family